MRLPKSDRFSVTRDKLKADMAVAMGGRVAEEMIFGYDKVTSGASSDISQATKIARAMVREWGMSDSLGLINYGNDSQDMYTQTPQKFYSVNTEDLIDKEVKKLVDEAHDRAREVLTKHKAQLHKIASALLEKETLTGDELRELVFGKKAAEEYTAKTLAEAKASHARESKADTQSTPTSKPKVSKRIKKDKS